MEHSSAMPMLELFCSLFPALLALCLCVQETLPIPSFVQKEASCVLFPLDAHIHFFARAGKPKWSLFRRKSPQKVVATNSGTIRGISGTYKGAVFSIGNGETLTFGRDSSLCHIIFDSSNISRIHCTIRYDGQENKYYVKDVSRNGTYYEDGSRMQPQRERPAYAGEKIYLDNPGEMFELG